MSNFFNGPGFEVIELSQELQSLRAQIDEAKSEVLKLKQKEIELMEDNVGNNKPEHFQMMDKHGELIVQAEAKLDALLQRYNKLSKGQDNDVDPLD